jgi:hypothetical protein
VELAEEAGEGNGLALMTPRAFLGTNSNHSSLKEKNAFQEEPSGRTVSSRQVLNSSITAKFQLQLQPAHPNRKSRTEGEQCPKGPRAGTHQGRCHGKAAKQN